MASTVAAVRKPLTGFRPNRDLFEDRQHPPPLPQFTNTVPQHYFDKVTVKTRD